MDEDEKKLLFDVAQTVTQMDKKMDLFIQETRFELVRIKELDVQQNRILEEHHQRSTEIKRDNELREAAMRAEIVKTNQRVTLLEKPWKYLAGGIKASWKLLLIGGAAAEALHHLIVFFHAK